MSITQKQRANLIILADFLERVVPPPKFDISAYLMDADGEITPDSAKNKVYKSCGTTACAAGHGPLAGIKWKESDGSDWNSYCTRAFGAPPISNLWEWLFSPDWADIDNTPEGAAARIKWYLAHGTPDYDEILDQQNGDTPLCYTDLIVRNIKEPVYVMETPKKD